MRFRALLCVGLLTPAACAHAVLPTPPAPEVRVVVDPAPAARAAAPEADPSGKVCKVARELGSNRLKRTCRTREQLEGERAAARETLSREQRR